MIITILLWIYIFVLSALYGWQISIGVKRLFGGKSTNIWVLCLLGLVGITTIASFLSLIIPISLVAHLIVLAGGIFILIFQFGKIKSDFIDKISRLQKIHWGVWVLFTLATLTTLEIATRVPTNPDSGQYHVQAIHWIESYRVVPGLGNLLTRFAFNSNWFLSSAVFSLAFLGGKSFHLVPSLLFLMGIFYSLSGITSLSKKDFKLSTIFRSLLLPVAFILLPSQVSSPGTDLPVTISTWIIISEWLGIVEEKGESHLFRSSLLWIIACFCVTVKLSSVFLIVGMIYLLIIQKSESKLRFLLWNLAFAGVILIPWLIRNVIISGYLIYPFPFIDIFKFDWKIPLVNAYSDMHAIQNFAKFSGRSDSQLFSTTFFGWVPQWWNHLSIFKRFILFSILPLPLEWMVLWIIKLKFKLNEFSISYLPIYIFTFLGTIFWFFSSPDFRFGYGFIMSAFILVYAPLLMLILHFSQQLSRIIPFVLIFLFIGYQGYVLYRSVEVRTLSERLILPADYPHLPSQPCKILNATVFTPSVEAWSECWYAPFPCTPHCEAGIEMRGNSLQDGYRWP